MPITKEEIDKLARNGAHFYEAMKQNNYFMPRAGMKSPLCTVGLFTEVTTNKCWLPK